MYELDTKAQLK